MKRALQIVGLNGMALLFALAPLAAAQDSHVSQDSNGKEITGSLNWVKTLRVRVDMGSVVVHGSQQPNITYVIHTRFGNSGEDARRQADQYKVTAYVKGDTAWIVGDWQGGKRPRHFSGEFNINVPRDMALVKLETEGGNIDAAGVTGRVEAESGGGTVKLDDIGAGAHAETGGGSIEVGTVGGDLGVHTGGGSIEIRRANGKIVAETGGGAVEIQSGQDATIETGGGAVKVQQCSGRVKVDTGGGTVELDEVGGPAKVDTGGGNIRVNSAKEYVQADTGGGGIELIGVPSAHAETGAGSISVKLINTGAERHDSDLETGAGDITVYIAADVAINVRASVDMGSGHRITSDFPDIHVSSEGDHWGPKTLTAEGKLNGGGPTLKVHTSTGDICLRKASR